MKEKIIHLKAGGFFRSAGVVVIALLVILMVLTSDNIAFSKTGFRENIAEPPQEISFAKISELAELDSRKELTLEEAELAADENGWVTMRMRVTGYCACPKCCGKFSDGKTATGHRIKWGDRFVAAPKWMKFGTEIIVPGYNHSQPVKVIDRGRVIKGNRLDVFYNTHHTASKWGVKYLDVKVKLKK